jgi:hypothetical protein
LVPFLKFVSTEDNIASPDALGRVEYFSSLAAPSTSFWFHNSQIRRDSFDVYSGDTGDRWLPLLEGGGASEFIRYGRAS